MRSPDMIRRFPFQWLDRQPDLTRSAPWARTTTALRQGARTATFWLCAAASLLVLLRIIILFILTGATIDRFRERVDCGVCTQHFNVESESTRGRNKSTLQLRAC